MKLADAEHRGGGRASKDRSVPPGTRTACDGGISARRRWSEFPTFATLISRLCSEMGKVCRAITGQTAQLECLQRTRLRMRDHVLCIRGRRPGEPATTQSLAAPQTRPASRNGLLRASRRTRSNEEATVCRSERDTATSKAGGIVQPFICLLSWVFHADQRPTWKPGSRSSESHVIGNRLPAHGPITSSRPVASSRRVTASLVHLPATCDLRHGARSSDARSAPTNAIDAPSPPNTLDNVHLVPHWSRAATHQGARAGAGRAPGGTWEVSRRQTTHADRPSWRR